MGCLLNMSFVFAAPCAEGSSPFADKALLWRYSANHNGLHFHVTEAYVCVVVQPGALDNVCCYNLTLLHLYLWRSYMTAKDSGCPVYRNVSQIREIKAIHKSP